MMTVDTHVEEQVAGPESSALTSEDSLAAAGHRLLRRHFRKLQAQEEDVREDKDIEAVHQMRVATRRLRAALVVVAEVAPAGQVRAFQKDIRRIARSSSSVRDADVFLEEIADYIASHPDAQPDDLAPLTDALRADRAAAYQVLCRRLNSKRYASFKHRFAAFLDRSDTRWDATPRICDMAGSLIWRRYEALRAFEQRVQPGNIDVSQSEELHNTRIAGKRLRYTIEVFGEVFGPKVDQVLDPLKAFQDNLGSLQDVAVAHAYVAGLPLPETNGQRAALEAYIAAREAERTRLLAALPRLWEKVFSVTYRRKLMDLIIRL